jgi:hypothetical protein
VVEAQHEISTRGLVDTLDEQIILEEIVDEAKPPAPSGSGFHGLHYLLSTPFRYPPLANGSRFGSVTERSLWYGALELETSLAEKAYYQLLFVAGTTATLKDLSCRWSAFRASVKADRGVDLCGPQFAAHHPRICSPSSYADSQPLGSAMRGAGVQVFWFPSARCPRHGKAFGMFEPVFSTNKPTTPTTWECWMIADGCEVIHRSPRKVMTFKRADFEVAGKFPMPSVAVGSR